MTTLSVLSFKNVQPVEKQTLHPEGLLDVHSVWATIQGEGPFVGVPAIFVRLAGCNLSCHLCDTEYTQGRTLWSIQDLTGKIKALAGGVVKLVVLTGGEPLRQGLGTLVDLLLGMGFKVQLETNGTLFDPTLLNFYSRITTVCSPKTAKLSSQLLSWIHHYKYILSADAVDSTDGLPLDSLGTGVRPARPGEWFRGGIYVQPLDEGDEGKNQRHRQAAVASCLRYGYTLCLQTHKIVGLP